MKKLALMIILAFVMQSVFADETANIKINIAGASPSNRYFLCLPNVGCLSIHAAMVHHKIFPMYHRVKMSQIFVADTYRGFRVYAQGLPASCDFTLMRKKTITISGTLVKGPLGNVKLKGLHCSQS